jgi:ribosomal protein S18 acetylase RimI-like enzyme
MIEVTRATHDDLEALLPLVSAYRSFYQQDRDGGRERAFVARHLKDGTSTIYLARDERGIAVGFVQLFQTYSTVKLGPLLILEDLFVAPEARGRGVASKLLARAVERSREISAVGMFLETAMDNVVAQRMYERAGWERESRFYKYNAPQRA